jgi:hypothetical protein
MSAFIVEREHIGYLIEAATSRRIMARQGAFRWRGKELHDRDRDKASEVGQMLWAENVKSVAHRYSHRDDCPEVSDYEYGTHDARPVAIEPVEVIKACHCYEYQSCEHPEWETSEAKEFIDRLCRAATQSLVGYEEAEWGCPKSCFGQPAAVVFALHR